MEDVRTAARQQLFSYLGGLPQGGDQPWVEDYVNKMMQDRRFVDETYQRLKTDKMMGWLESQVKPVDQAISVEEFNKLQEEHQHTHGEEHRHAACMKNMSMTTSAHEHHS